MNVNHFVIQKGKKNVSGRRNSKCVGTEQLEARGTIQRILQLMERENESKKKKSPQGKHNAK